MTLTQQFLIVSILPLSFLLMAAFTWQRDVQRPYLGISWVFTLIAAALWSSSALRFYGGTTFSLALVHTWGVVGSYLFGLVTLGILFTTLTNFTIPDLQGQMTIGISLFFLLLAFVLDPDIWSYQLGTVRLGGILIRHFDLWAAVWVTSWLLPVSAAWLLTQQVNTKLPSSIYRNQVHYWRLVLTLIFIGGALVSIRQPGQPVWQEIGVLFLLLAMLTGTISIAKTQLPELQLAVRQILSRLSGTLIIFGLTWLALSIIVQGITNLRGDTKPNLILTLAAAAFAGLFTLIYRLVNELTRRLFVPAVARRKVVLAAYTNTIGNLPEPGELGQIFLRILQSSLATDEAYLFLAEDGPKGKLILRPLASLGEKALDTVSFSYDSPFVTYVRQNHAPLVQYDIDTLNRFRHLTESERAVLLQWQCVLYMPLYTGENLVGLLGLGEKFSGASYDAQDFELLQTLAGQVSPLLAQAQNMASLRRINDFVFQQNQLMGQEKQLLAELADLHGRFIKLVSPELRRPFTDIKQKLTALGQTVTDEPCQALVKEIDQQFEALKVPLDHLITMSARIQRRSEFNFRPIHMDGLARNAIRNLHTMADARRVRVNFDTIAALPTVLGDGEQLREAIQQLLHNAIKFNRIGGSVDVRCTVNGGDVCVHVVDNGVGIPAERLETIWSGFDSLERPGLGAGLGLPLTHFIAAAHGGRVLVTSTYGSGSTFSLLVPMTFED